MVLIAMQTPICDAYADRDTTEKDYGVYYQSFDQGVPPYWEDDEDEDGDEEHWAAYLNSYGFPEDL